MGPHIFQTCPSANYFDCKAMSIGARSQSARTYLERLMDKFIDCKRNKDMKLSFLQINYKVLLFQMTTVHQISNFEWNLRDFASKQG